MPTSKAGLKLSKLGNFARGIERFFRARPLLSCPLRFDRQPGQSFIELVGPWSLVAPNGSRLDKLMIRMTMPAWCQFTRSYVVNSVKIRALNVIRVFPIRK